MALDDVALRVLAGSTVGKAITFGIRRLPLVGVAIRSGDVGVAGRGAVRGIGAAVVAAARIAGGGLAAAGERAAAAAREVALAGDAAVRTAARVLPAALRRSIRIVRVTVVAIVVAAIGASDAMPTLVHDAAIRLQVGIASAYRSAAWAGPGTTAGEVDGAATAIADGAAGMDAATALGRASGDDIVRGRCNRRRMARRADGCASRRRWITGRPPTRARRRRQA